MSSNELNNFDQLLKGKLESQNIPFNESDWNKLEKKLPPTNGKPFWNNPWLWSGAALITVLVVSYTFIQNEKVQSINGEIVSNQKVVNELNETNVSSTNTSIIDTVSTGKTDNEILTENQESGITTVPSNDSKENENSATPSNQTNVKQKETNENEVNSVPSDVTETQQTFYENNSPVVSKPLAEIIVKKSEICQNEFLQFECKTQENVDYIWDFGDTHFSKEQNPRHKFLQAGTFIVGLTVRSKIDNTILTKSKETLITVNETPSVNFETEEQINLGIPSISFINTTNKGNSWSWNFGDGNISSDKDPNHSYKRKGNYDVSLTSENEYKCSNTQTKKVFVENDYNLLAPNSFTPNGDGINDLFIPEALKVMDVEFVMSIYSQNQGLLFETKNINQQWDGINQQTGEKCINGNYIWVVTLTTKDGKIEQYKGAVLILE